MEKAFKVTFSDDLTAQVIRIHRTAELPLALGKLSLRQPTSTLVLVGGAGGLSNAELNRLCPLFTEVLVPLAEALGISVVDGGTDAGVMSLVGHARAEANAAFPLVGVAALGTVTLPSTSHSPPDAAPLEPHHTHFVLVPGFEWGDESPWLARVASALSDGEPSVTVLVNGGEIAWADVLHSVEARRPVIAVNGSGRTADKLAEMVREDTADERVEKVLASGLLQAVDLTAGADTLAATIGRCLSRE